MMYYMIVIIWGNKLGGENMGRREEETPEPVKLYHKRKNRGEKVNTHTHTLTLKITNNPVLKMDKSRKQALQTRWQRSL